MSTLRPTVSSEPVTVVVSDAEITSSAGKLIVTTSEPSQLAPDAPWFGLLVSSADSYPDARGGLLNHFAVGEGSGAPDDDARMWADRTEGSATLPAQDFEKGGWPLFKSSGSEYGHPLADRDFPGHGDPMRIAMTGASYYRFEEIVIVETADVNPARFPAHEVRGGGDVTVTRPAADTSVMTPASVVATPSVARPAARDGAAARTVLDPAIANVRALMAAASRVTDVAKSVTPAVFATAVIANANRESPLELVAPVAMLRGAAAFGTAGVVDASASVGSSPGESSGAIFVAQAVLRIIRSFAGDSQITEAPANVETTLPQNEGSWDAPMFLSAKMLGLAPGNPWMMTPTTAGQRTLRWVAGVSLLITVAGCWYCVATTARARRSALDEALEDTLYVAL